MTDQIADLLIRIKNAAAVGQHQVFMPHTKMKEAILKILESNGFVKSSKVVDEKGKKLIKIELSDTKYFSHILQISKPGHRVYKKSKEIRVPLRGFGLLVVSTSTGIVTAQEAIQKGLGGVVICEIW